MTFVRILVLCVAAAILFGVVHDQITARVCVEYFTIGHPRLIDSESPTVLGLYWGVVATWWVGLLLGVPLAIAATRGDRPRRSVTSIVRPVSVLLGVMAVMSLVSGFLGYVLASSGFVILLEPLSTQVPPERHIAFIADLWAHSASYLAAFVGGIILIVRVWRSRRVTLAHPPA